MITITYSQLNDPSRFSIKKIESFALHFGQYDKWRGLFIDGRLAILVDTEETMHALNDTVQKPFRFPLAGFTASNLTLQEFAPTAVRQLINIVMYAITHGKISDYSNYNSGICLKRFWY